MDSHCTWICFLTFLISFYSLFLISTSWSFTLWLWILQTILNYRDIICPLTQIIYFSMIARTILPCTDLEMLLVQFSFTLLVSLDVVLLSFLFYWCDNHNTERLGMSPNVTQQGVVKYIWIQESDLNVHVHSLLSNASP